MTDPVQPPAAAGGGSSKLGMAVGFTILFVVFAFSGALGVFGTEVQRFCNGLANGARSLLSVGGSYAGVFLALAAVYYFRKKK